LHAGLTPSGATAPDGHLAVPIRLQVNGGPEFAVPAKVFGPGDVTGIDGREVIRTDPVHFQTDFEPNYFPSIEFDRPDFPWLFTPAVADGSGHLQPWICLVVLPRAVASLQSAPNQPLPVLECVRAELPNPAEAWAWAHAQITEGTTRIIDPALDATTQKQVLSDMLKRHPERSLSRLLSPRRLEPNTAYIACVVPAFEAGRKTGMGEAITAADEAALLPAWQFGGETAGSDRIRLPVYFSWEFSTGMEGDFESLARRLEKRQLPATLGLRAMTIAKPGWGMPALPPNAEGTVLGLEGALRTLDTESTPWPEPARATFQNALRKILNAPEERASAEDQSSLIGPPLYGQWHAKQRTVAAAHEPPHWFSELNLDPRDRVAAGLGAQVIRLEQEQLMASAWEQLARHEADNQQRKREQLAEAVGAVLADKHLHPLPLGSLIQVTEPLRRSNSRPRAPGPVPPAPLGPMASAAFRRITRGRGPLARRMMTAVEERSPKERSAPDQPRSLTARLNDPRALAGSLATTVREAKLALMSVSGTLPRAGSPGPTPTTLTGLARVRERVLRDVQVHRWRSRAVRGDEPGTESTELVRFAPEFPQPMYEPLRDYSPAALFPGLEEVPPNTISLLKTNPRFIEAYMVGLNHEMARELLWRGYPTGQRGTCFRQFWDILGRVPLPPVEEREVLKDIEPITRWEATAHLGENTGAGSAEGQIVLLIRGDLLRRYPRAMVYAAEAAWSEDGSRRLLGTEERYPIFRATRAPDITMLGFPLTEDHVIGAVSRDAGHPGWFFVLQEQPTEPRFGLDADTAPGVPQHWRDLTWGHLAADENSLKQLIHVPLEGPLSGRTLDHVRWGENSGHMAFITRQRPFRVAIHARAWLTQT
jgi:hypothetical protein